MHKSAGILNAAVEKMKRRKYDYMDFVQLIMDKTISESNVLYIIKII